MLDYWGVLLAALGGRSTSWCFSYGSPWRPEHTLEWHKAGRVPTRPVRRGR